MAVECYGEQRELKERVVEINRVAKVVKGGRRFSFTALVVIGDEVDRVGVGYGKAREVPLAISKAVDDAKKNLFTVPKHGTTITHESLGRFDAARVLLRPASRGYRRHRRRRRPRRARARRHPRHPRQEPRHDEPDQHAEGDRQRAAEPAAARGGRAGPRHDGSATSCRCRPSRAGAGAGGRPQAEASSAAAEADARVTEAAPAERRPAEAPAARAARARPRPPSRPLAESRRGRRPSAERRGRAGGRTRPDGQDARSRRSAARSARASKHRGTLRALGLGHIGRTAEHQEGPVLAGMLGKVRHLVKVEEA